MDLAREAQLSSAYNLLTFYPESVWVQQHLYLLEDAAGGGEAVKVLIDQFGWNVADLLIWEALDRINLAGRTEKDEDP